MHAVIPQERRSEPHGHRPARLPLLLLLLLAVAAGFRAAGLPVFAAEAGPSREARADPGVLPGSGDVHEILFRANQAYLEGRYEEAAGLYEHILAAGHLNGNLLYNLGNCDVRRGQVGRAILSYRRARLLLPRDGDLKANLQYARSLAPDRIEGGGVPLWKTLAFWYSGLDFRGLLCAFTVLNVLFWGALGLALYRNSEWVKWTLALSLILCLVLGVSAAFKYRETFHNPEGVLLAPEVQVRSGFSRNDTVLFLLHEGVEFRILDTQEGWWKIQLPDGKKGWLPPGVAGRVALDALGRQDRGETSGSSA